MSEACCFVDGSGLRTVVRNGKASRIGCLLDQSSRARRREDVEVCDFSSPRSERVEPNGIGPSGSHMQRLHTQPEKTSLSLPPATAPSWLRLSA
eukprot:354001-Chlamydomonas_euryale.AAC.1